MNITTLTAMKFAVDRFFIEFNSYQPVRMNNKGRNLSTPPTLKYSRMSVFSEYNQQDATFLKFIYFYKTLYMFQTGFPSIIRITNLHVQRQTFVRPLLLPAASLAIRVRLAAGSSFGLTNA